MRPQQTGWQLLARPIQVVPEESSSMEGIKPDGDKSGKYKDRAGQEMPKARYQSKLLSTSLFQVTMCL